MLPYKPYEEPRWQGLHSRVTYYDLALSIRIDPNTGERSTVAFSNKGAIELPGEEPYFHPSVTSGLEAEAHQIDPWDEALDELNGLTSEAKEQALRSLNSAESKKEVMSAYLVMGAVRRVSEELGLDRAA